MKFMGDFGDAFDELLELGFVEKVGTTEDGEAEYRFTDIGTNYMQWQRKIEEGEMLTPDDFENRYAWAEAIDTYKAKRDPNYKPKPGW